MLSTRFSIAARLRTGLAAAALAILAACTTGPQVATGPDDGIPVDLGQPVQVALLVPQGSGDAGREAIARSLVNAARLAQQDIRGAQIDLEVYGTSGTTPGGASAAQQAVDEGAKIIVGPLFSTATAGAAPVARAAGLNVLSFSNNATVAGGNVYLVGLTFENAARELVDYAGSRGLRSIGVVYPAGLEGETARNAVSRAAAGAGVEVVAARPYNLSVSSIASAAGPIVADLQAAGANAVVLTDGPTGGLAYIADALRGGGLSPAGVQFLGMQRWDSSTAALALPSLQGGVFAAPDPGSLNAFEARYRAAYGEAPHELAGLAYDAVAAVGAMIAEAQARGGTPFSTGRLTQPSGFAGVNGPFRFTPDGMNQRNLAILAVQNGQAVVAEPAARSLDAAGF